MDKLIMLLMMGEEIVFRVLLELLISKYE
jgi:hypothetical protein